jgi:hypothetical protein
MAVIGDAPRIVLNTPLKTLLVRWADGSPAVVPSLAQ